MLFFFGQRLVPNILAQTKLRTRGFGFALRDFTAIFQKFLNKRIIGVFFLDMFHGGTVAGLVGNANGGVTDRRVGLQPTNLVCGAPTPTAGGSEFS